MTTRRQESQRLPLSAGGALQLDLSYAAKPRDGAVLFVHGFGSSRKGEKALALEGACARRGWTFAAFDFRGHGESSGTLLELRGSTLLEDLETVRAFLEKRGMARLCLVGSSMGGWAAAWFTFHRPEIVSACAAIAPAFNFVRQRWERLSEAERLQWQQTGRHRLKNEWLDAEIGYGLVEESARFPVEQLISRWSKPLLIFHGLQDETIPFAQSLAFIEKAPAAEIELRLYKNAGHRLLPWKDEMAEAACDFFARRVSRAKS